MFTIDEAAVGRLNEFELASVRTRLESSLNQGAVRPEEEEIARALMGAVTDRLEAIGKFRAFKARVAEVARRDARRRRR